MNPQKVGKQLSQIVTGTVLWDKDARNFYSVDASSYTLKPLVIVLPKDSSDIIKIIKFASRYKIPITPRGAGTGLVGSALGRGIILDMSYFRKIKLGVKYVEVESGVNKGELDKILQRHGKFLGPNPSVGSFCTIGGMIATNASGSHSLKYGSIVDNLIEVTMITSDCKVLILPNHHKKMMKLASSDILNQFPRVSKNSCGYRIDKIQTRTDLQRIAAGSEGTLGIIISAKLKIHSLPKDLLLIILSYKTIMQAVKEVPDLMDLHPLAIELVDANIARHMKMKTPKNGCLLFVEFDTNIHQNKFLLQHLTAGKILKTVSKNNEIKKIWAHRNSALSYSLRSITKRERIPTLIEDATVPIRRLPLLLKLLDIISRKYKLRLIIYGHAGNGNLHIRPILKKKDKKIIKKLALEFFSGVIGIGGTITGEHGDGLARSEFVKLQYGSEIYSIFKALKKQFDPKNILNPGKIISEKSTVTRHLRI